MASTMLNEYGDMDSSGSSFVLPSLALESGEVLKMVEVRYKSYGALNRQKTNCMVVCHALTGNAALDVWWKEMFGEGKLFDPSKYFIVCANILGSCYGTCGPTSIKPDSGEPYGTSFPDVTVRDSVNLHLALVKDHLGVAEVACVVGGSLGGMQALEWGLLGGPGFVKSLIVMCCGAYLHPWQLGLSEVQRQAIYADPLWNGGSYAPEKPPHSGLSVARQLAMISYRSHVGYGEKFGRATCTADAGNGQRTHYEVEKYLRYQGTSFCSRFDALSYVKCTRMMDTHDVGRGRGSVGEALQRLTQPCLVLSISSDNLYPVPEQEELHNNLPNSEWHIIESNNGHDGFLLDQESVLPLCHKFLGKHQPQIHRSQTLLQPEEYADPPPLSKAKY